MPNKEVKRIKIMHLLFICSSLVLLGVATRSVSANTCIETYNICIDTAKKDSAKEKTCLSEFNWCGDNNIASHKKCEADKLACTTVCSPANTTECLDKCTVDFAKCEAVADIDPASTTNLCDNGDKVCKDACASVNLTCVTAAGSDAAAVATCNTTQISCVANCSTSTETCKKAPTSMPPAPSATPPPASISLANPLGSKVDIKDMVGEVIKISLGFLGSLALLMFVYGGFLWMTSRGKTESIKQGSTTMLWAAIGIVFVFSSYGLLVFILDLIGAA